MMNSLTITARVFLVFCFCCFAFASEFTPSLLSSPWVVRNPDSSVSVSFEVFSNVSEESLKLFCLKKDEIVDREILATKEIVARPYKTKTAIISFSIPKESVVAGLWQVCFLKGISGEDENLLSFLIQDISSIESSLILLGTADNYPSKDVVDKITSRLTEKNIKEKIEEFKSKAAKKTPKEVFEKVSKEIREKQTEKVKQSRLMLLIGEVPYNDLGNSGWESDINIFFLQSVEKQKTIKNKGNFGFTAWRSKVKIGSSSFFLNTKGKNNVIVKDNNIWSIFVDDNALWDIGATASSDKKNVDNLEELLGTVIWKKGPLILSSGTGSSFISEPLSIDRIEASILVTNGGVRYVDINSTLSDFISLPKQVSLPFFNKVNFALSVKKEQMDLLILNDGKFFELQYDKEKKMNGWGNGDPNDFIEEKQPLPFFISQTDLSNFFSTELKITKALDLALSKDTIALDILIKLEWVVVGKWADSQADLPEKVIQNWVLRQVDREGVFSDKNLKNILKKTTDEKLLKSLLRILDEKTGTDRFDLLQIFLHRLKKQANDEMPMEEDPLLQHRIIVKIVDSPFLSSKMIDPIVVPLLKKCKNLAKNVLIRYMARVWKADRIASLVKIARSEILLEALYEATMLLQPNESEYSFRSQTKAEFTKALIAWRSRTEDQLKKKLTFEKNQKLQIKILRMLFNNYIEKDDKARFIERIVNRLSYMTKEKWFVVDEDEDE